MERHLLENNSLIIRRQKKKTTHVNNLGSVPDEGSIEEGMIESLHEGGASRGT